MGAVYRKLAILVTALRFHPRSKLRRLALAVALIFPSACAHAKPGDTFEPFVFCRLTMDNNLFRASSNEQTDRYQQLGAGVLLDWKQSRQEVTGKIGANKTTFSKNGVLDFSGYDLLGQWNWQLGNHTSGQLGYSKTRSLGSFQDNSIGQTQNTVDEEKKFFNASYSLHPRWRINGSVDTDTADYSAAALKASNHTLDHFELSTDYLTPKGSRLSFYAGRWNGNYPNRQVSSSSIVDNSYKQDEVGIRTFLVLDGKLQISGQIGQTRRTQKELSQRDFSGLTGRLNTNWQATGKLQVAGSIYRNIGAVDDISASYAISDGIRLTPSLQITPKLMLSAETYYENRNFKGDPFPFFSPLFGPRRKDTATGASLSLTYQPDTWALLTLSYQTGKRDTNNQTIANDFTYQMLSFLVVLEF